MFQQPLRKTLLESTVQVKSIQKTGILSIYQTNSVLFPYLRRNIILINVRQQEEDLLENLHQIEQGIFFCQIKENMFRLS